MKSELSKHDIIKISTNYGEFKGKVIGVDKTEPHNVDDYSVKMLIEGPQNSAEAEAAPNKVQHRFWSHEIINVSIIERTKSPEKITQQQWTENQVAPIHKPRKKIATLPKYDRVPYEIIDSLPSLNKGLREIALMKEFGLILEPSYPTG